MCKLTGAVVLLVVVLGAYAYGQSGEPGEVTCPVDDCHFKAPAGEPGDAAGGVDSDECRHPIRGQTLPYMMLVCPRCNYAAGRLDFTSERTEEQKRLILRRLRDSRYRGVADSMAEIPGWERFRLAAKCAALLGNERDQINFCKFAAWSARTEACLPATVAYSDLMRIIAPVERPINQWVSARGIRDVIAEIEDKLASETAPAEKARLRLHLAMMCQRAGLAARRDRTLGQLAALPAADAARAANVKRFRRLVAIETEFQEELVELIEKRLPAEKTRWDRTALTYVLADTLRRLGRDAEAVGHFRAARKMMSTPSELRLYTDHFLSMLAPGEPLPVPEPEKEPETEKTASEPKEAPKTAQPEVSGEEAPKE